MLWVAWLVIRANTDAKMADKEALLMRHLVILVRERHEVVDEQLANLVASITWKCGGAWTPSRAISATSSTQQSAWPPWTATSTPVRRRTWRSFGSGAVAAETVVRHRPTEADEFAMSFT
ncbi:hypothetical protein [Streptomyces sp. NPDC005004]